MASTCPFCRTTTCFALFNGRTRCVTNNNILLRPSSDKVDTIFSSASPSKSDVISSSKSIDESSSRARTTAIFCRCPLDKSFPFSPTGVWRPSGKLSRNSLSPTFSHSSPRFDGADSGEYSDPRSEERRVGKECGS